MLQQWHLELLVLVNGGEVLNTEGGLPRSYNGGSREAGRERHSLGPDVERDRCWGWRCAKETITG